LQDAGASKARLYRSARGKPTHELRRYGRAVPVGEDAEAIAASEDETDFSPADAAEVHAALNELGAEHREALVLRFVDDLSYDEIAAIVGCPSGTVRSRMHYAKQALKRLLEKRTRD
jgi:RNA polymerase sigma-70 factor (ECF subfamily)